MNPFIKPLTIETIPKSKKTPMAKIQKAPATQANHLNSIKPNIKVIKSIEWGLSKREHSYINFKFTHTAPKALTNFPSVLKMKHIN